MQGLQANSEKFRCACLVVCSGEGLQNEFAFHGVYSRAQRKTQRREFGSGGGVGTAEIRGKMAAADQVPVTHDDGAFEHIAQLADVSRPGVIVKKFADFRIDAANLPAVFGIKVAQNVLDERREILFAIAQCGQMNVKNVETE